jgi:hypothetical protein
MRKLGLISLCLALLAAALPLASAYAEEAPVSPALCLESGTGDIVFKTNTTSCPASRCTTDNQCRAQCSQAISASCVAGACQYTLPGGGTGTGGSGGACPRQSRCVGDSQCLFPGGIQGTCSGGTCHC